MKYIITYLLIINFYGICIMYIDKKRSKVKKWRVSEFRIFMIALLFGSIGVLIGMKGFRHKTKHLKFVYGIPAIIIVQLYIIYEFMPVILNF